MPPITTRPQILKPPFARAAQARLLAHAGEVDRESSISPTMPARHGSSVLADPAPWPGRSPARDRPESDAHPRLRLLGSATRLTALSLGPWLLLACPTDGTTTTDSSSDGEPTATTTTSGTTDPDGTTTTTTGTPTTAEPTTEPPTSSTTAPAPAVCGDSIVADGEVCDDGNDEADDGCNKNCEKTGAVLWTYTHSGAAGEHDAVGAVAVDPTGKIIIAGREGVGPGDSDMLLIALAPDGSELWKKTYPDMNGLPNFFYAVVLGEDGTIYAAGAEEQVKDVSTPIVRSFDPDGNEGWTFLDPPADMLGASISGLLFAGGELYSAGAEDITADDTQLTLRRHDIATGEADWKAVTQAEFPRALGYGIVKTEGGVLVAGLVQDDKNMSKPLLVVVDDAGAIVSVDVEDHPGGAWFEAEAVGGDIALVGRRAPEGVTGYDFALRRVGPDLAEQWTETYDHEFLYGTGTGLAVGPDERIFASGFHVAPAQFDDIFGGLYAGDGTRQWTHTYNNDDIDLYDDGSDAGWGPDFLILAGESLVLGEQGNVWVRAFKAD